MVQVRGAADPADQPNRPSPVTAPHAPVERQETPEIAAIGATVLPLMGTGDQVAVLAPAGATCVMVSSDAPRVTTVRVLRSTRII